MEMGSGFRLEERRHYEVGLMGRGNGFRVKDRRDCELEFVKRESGFRLEEEEVSTKAKEEDNQSTEALEDGTWGYLTVNAPSCLSSMR